jgi:hypothetical protein
LLLAVPDNQNIVSSTVVFWKEILKAESVQQPVLWYESFTSLQSVDEVVVEEFVTVIILF